MSSKLTAKDIITHRFTVFVVVVAAINVQGLWMNLILFRSTQPGGAPLRRYI